MEFWIFITIYLAAIVIHIVAWAKVTIRAFNSGKGWGWSVLLFNPLFNIPAICFLYLNHEERIQGYTVALFAPYVALVYFLIRYVDWTSVF